MFNKGAMFGLDARIALAIFGALSIISAASLYGAIDDSKVTNQHQMFQETFKAIESYMIDTGTLDMSNILDEIVINTLNKPGWKGPYLKSSLASDPGTGSLYIENLNRYTKVFNSHYGLHHKSNSDWPADESGWGINCSKTSICKQTLRFSSSNTAEDRNQMQLAFNALDEKIDNGDGPSKGMYRLRKPSGENTGFYYIYILGTLVPQSVL